MISAIVLVPDLRSPAEAPRATELIVRSLVWLVSAVVSGVVRDVILAAPAPLDLADVVDQSGCELVQAECEGDRLAAAVTASRERCLLVIRSGYQPELGLVDELGAFLRANTGGSAVMLSAPETVWQRLFPARAEAVAVLIPRHLLLPSGKIVPLAFRPLVKSARHATRLRSSARRID